MQKVLFLDRDGVVNVDKDYLFKIEDFEFLEGIFDLCKYYQSLSYKIVIVTNQSGIAREYYSKEDFQILTNWMIEEFKKNDIVITKVYYCPHHPSVSGKCKCRKPNPGMLFRLEEEFEVDFNNSIIIGDKERDIEAGLNAGIKETYLLHQDGNDSESKATRIVSRLDDIWKIKC